MRKIQIYFRPETPVEYSSLPSPKVRTKFRVSEADMKEIDRNWAKLASTRDVFSKPNSLGSLVECDSKGNSKFNTTEFKIYHAVTESDKLSDELYGSMRIGAVGSAVRSREGDIIVHKRGNTSHLPYVWDSSAAGLAVVRDGGMNLEQDLYNKITRELEISPEEIESMRVTDIHNVGFPDFSGMYSFLVDTFLTRDELLERGKMGVKEGGFAEVRMLGKTEVSNFVVDNFSRDKNDRGYDTCTDGGIVLASSLPQKEYEQTIDRLRESMNIAYGDLRNSKFV